MGVNYYYCFAQFPSPERLPLSTVKEEHGSLISSVIEFLKPKCFCGRNKNLWEKLEQSNNEQTKKKKQQMTVVKKEELIFEGEYYGSGGNWVYPSLGGEDSDDVTSNSRDSFSLLKLLTDESGKSDAHDPCLCRSESSGKVKKRVSFKLPEEADIFIFCSPDHQNGCEEGNLVTY
ncbi:hypothetical protein D8674_022167 [Pyrus ussuriensis x Pyrus communis]|uniref:Uncharacterized protein n=1 Tax=Pyrus ussuriensis x Pyrus communis TaxID=2448454 RepID=A0A5N5GJ92_9ROSA|nr:hypothetical protein D8674_022167 [Pyrus ussuriensis x Pyrus communis]